MTPVQLSVISALSASVALFAVVFKAGALRSQVDDLRAVASEVRRDLASLRVHLAALEASCPVCRASPTKPFPTSNG